MIYFAYFKYFFIAINKNQYKIHPYFFSHFNIFSPDSSTKNGSLVSKVIHVHSGKGQQYLAVLIRFGGKFYPELVSPRKYLVKAPIVNVKNLSNF